MSRTNGSQIRLLYFLAYASGAAWYPLFNVYLKERDLSGMQIGIVASVLPAIYFICQPFWGIGADRWGRNRALLLAIFASSLLMLGFMTQGDFLFYFLWTIFFAFFFNPVAPLIDSVTLDYIESSGKSSYGLLRMWGAIGWACFAPIVGYIISGRDMSLIFPMAAILLLFSGVIRLRSRHIQATDSALKMPWNNLGLLFKNSRLIVFLILSLVLAIGTTAIWTFYGVYLDDIGASRKLIGIAFSVEGISEIPFYLISAIIIRKIGLTNTLKLTFFVSAIRVFFYSVISTPVMAVAVETCHGLSYSLFIVAAVEYVNYLVPAHWRATGQSLFWAAYFGIGAILGNTWAGFLYDRVGIQKMFQVNGWIILAISIGALFAFRARKAGQKEKL